MLSFKQITKRFGNTKFVLHHYKDVLEMKQHVVKGDYVSFLKQHPVKQHTLLYRVKHDSVYSTVGHSKKPFSRKQLLTDADNQIKISESNPVLNQNSLGKRMMMIHHHHGQMAWHLHTNQSYQPNKTIVSKTIGKSAKAMSDINRKDFKDLYKLSNVVQHHDNIQKFLKYHRNLETRLYVHANKNGQVLLNNGQASFSSRHKFGQYINKTIHSMYHANGITRKYQHHVQSRYGVIHINPKIRSKVLKVANKHSNDDARWNKTNTHKLGYNTHNSIKRPKVRQYRQTSLHLS